VLICGLVFGGGIFEMCGEAFWKRVVVFCLTFGFGVLVSSVFISNKIVVNSQLPNPKIQSTIFNPPKASECINILAEMKQRENDLLAWLDKNKDASKKERFDKNKELADLSFRIKFLEELKELNKQSLDDGHTTTNLLYKERCYEF